MLNIWRGFTCIQLKTSGRNQASRGVGGKGFTILMLRNLDKKDFAVSMTDDLVWNIIRVLKKERLE